ncbi:IS200/IS605 family transposase [Streptomyces sp. NPDC056390]|uniref:IS200/IS605 family transposase n=1 Tax=Streptomyces sp. NPDC056390 TaxID=3345806 RepID=UPI0035D92F57
MAPRWEPNPHIRKGRTVIHTLHAHVVFTPKYRRGPFTDEILRRCEDAMRAICTDFKTELAESNGETDHTHLLVHHPPNVSLSRLVGSLKGVSAGRLRQEFPGHMYPARTQQPYLRWFFPTGVPGEAFNRGGAGNDC